jgi:hypothetical protein
MILTRIFGAWAYHRSCSHRARHATGLEMANGLGEA